MAEIDNLSITISANADSAEKSINGLIDSLRKLNQNLALGNVSKFANQMREITNSANGLKEVSSTISSIATAGRKLGDLSGYKTLNDQIRETESETKKLAKSIAESFDFKENGTEKAKQNIKGLTELIGVMFDKLGNGKNISQEADIFASMLPSMQGFKNVLDENYQAIKNFADEYKVFVNATQKGDLEHLFGSLKEASQITGIKFVDNQELAKFKDLEEYLGRIKELVGIDFMKGAANPIEGVKNLQHYFEEYAKSAEQAMQASMPDASFYKAEGEKLARTVEDIYNRIYNESAVKNPFDGIVEGLRSLQDITLPDFSGLNTLADAITRLNGVSPKNLKEIAKALSEVSKSNIGNASEQVNGFASVAQDIQNTAKPLQEMASGAEKASEAVALLVDKSYGFKNIGDFLNTGADAFKRISDAIAQDMFKNMRFDLVDTGRVTFETLRGAVEGVASSFQLMRSAFQGTDNDVIDMTDSFRVLRDSLGTTADDIKLIGTTMQESMDGMRDIENFQPPEIQILTGNIENDGRRVGEDFKRGFEDGLDGVEDIIDSIMRDISDSISGTAPMDDFSRMIHDIIMDMERYSSVISNMRQHPVMFDNEGYIDATRKLKEATDAWETYQRTVERRTRLGISESMSEASKEAQRLQERIHDLKRMMNDMDNEKTIVNVEQYKAWAKELDKIQARYDELMGKKKEAEKSGGNLNLLANLVALGHEIGNIANAFDKLANYGIKGLKLAFKPLDHVINEYKEKIKSIGDAFKGFTDRAKKELNKLSAFWKRSMKTFTFMLVRKAITAVITEVSDAVKSLALWSKQFGTIFNDSMSHITSNLSYIARSIVGAFEPIINAIVPAFNALSDAIARAAAKLGEFFAAMTGQGYYMAAKKQVTDYAESVDKANKAQKNLIAGLDDLNVITTPTSTSSGIEDVADQWEKIDVSDKMKDWVNQIKDLAKRLFAPIKNAWDKTKDHVIGGWKYMTGEIKKLLKDIGRDFLKVWEQPETQRIFENLFNTIGNIEEAIGHLARNFREAWNYNDNGLHILENIRDIILNISEHVLHMSEAFKKWADDLDFKPLLTAFEEFTRKVQPLINFIGNLIEDWWERVILRHWKWLIEEGVPHLLKVLGEVIDAFNFDKIRKDLQPVMDAFETMRENIETGIVNAFGNLGKAIAKFANSKEFTDFTKNVAWFMEQITAERVEKLFTALGTAILNVAESLMRFVGSDKFKDFMTKLFEWYDKLSVDDIAGFIQKVAFAIAAFKFTAFIGKGLAGFFQFLSVLQSFKGIGGIIGGMVSALGGLSSVALPLAGILAAVAVAGYSLVKSFGGISGVLDELSKHFGILKDAVSDAWERFNMSDTIVELKDAFKGLGDALGNQKSLWQALFYVLDAVGIILINTVTVGIKYVAELLTGFVEIVSGVLDIVGGLFDLLKGFFTGDSELVSAGWEKMCEGFKTAFQGVYDFLAAPGALVEGFVKAIADFFKWLKHVLIGDPIVLDLTDGIIQAFADMIKDVIEKVGKFVEDVKNWFIDLKDRAIEIFNELKEKTIQKFLEMKNKVIEKVTEMKNRVISKITELKNEAVHRFNELKEQAIQKFNELKDRAISAFEELKNNVIQRISSLKDDAAKLFDNMKQTLVGIAGNIAEDVSHQFWQMVDWASDAFWGVVNSASSILSQVPSAISGALSGVGSAVSGALSGIGGAVSRAFGSVVDTAKDLGRQVINGFDQGANQQSNNSKWFNNTDTWGKVTANAKRTFGINSPSKVFRQIGDYLVEGLDEGIEDNIDDSKKSIEKLYKGISSVDLPKFDIDAALPKSSLKMDSYSHADFSGTASFDEQALQTSMRSAIQESIGSLILPYLNDIANSSRETANKNLTISAKDVHTAVRVEDKRFKTQTGRSAFAY